MSPSSIARRATLFLTSITLSVTAAATFVTPALAQDTTSGGGVIIRPTSEPNALARHSSGALSFIQSRPQDALGQNIGLGYGIDGAYLFRFDRRGIFAMRADAGVLQYGNESKHVPLSSTVGGRIQVDVSTTNYIVPVSIGPQLMWPTGSVRPYANAGVGGQFFYTQSSIEGTDDSQPFASTTNQWDKTLAWVAGGGVYVPLYERRFNVMFDIGAQYVNGGHARYLKPGSIEDLPDSQIRITSMESATHLVLVKFGVRVGM